ncbi:MAG: hypothetical protein KF764_19745, partial [Labilithrix sp.]|nr:hypothetical protein [Labilithrix sp.]
APAAPPGPIASAHRRPAPRATSDAPLYLAVAIGAVVLALVVAGGALLLKLRAAALATPPSAASAATPAPGSPEDATPTPVPPFVPLVRDATIDSTLPCPEGTAMKRIDSKWIYCGNTKWTFEGPSLRFHENGKLARQETYVRGRRSGLSWSFKDDGTLETIERYAEGALDGVRVELHPSGRTRTEYVYRQGKRHGVGREWGRDGALTRWVRYDDGTIVETKKR